jgi:hypothetical protein
MDLPSVSVSLTTSGFLIALYGHLALSPLNHPQIRPTLWLNVAMLARIWMFPFVPYWRGDCRNR